MKKTFKNILAKKGNKNGVTVLIYTIMLAVSLGTLVGCSITKENTEDGSGPLGTDISTESTLSADVTIQGDNLIVTLTHSEFPDCPAGTFFEFEPGQP